MAGKIKKALDEIIEQRSNGNATLASTTRTKLMLKGMDPDKYSDSSPDDPGVIEQIHKIAADFGVTLTL
jgi:hypothetical protein